MQATYLTETYGLADQHRTMLEIRSSISPKVIAQRGYATATDPDELSDLGFESPCGASMGRSASRGCDRTTRGKIGTNQAR
jgi:hypothetical protein